MNRFDKFLSYIYPITIESTNTDFNTSLEVEYSNGKYKLNSANANYSYGGLYDLFNLVFKQVTIEWSCISNVLILGFGAGCTVPLIRGRSPNCRIVGIEIDQTVIDLGEKYFGIKQYTDITVLCNSAFDFVTNSNQSFDLIIVDVFIDLEVPKEVESLIFLQNVKRILSINGLVIFNKLIPTKAHRNQIPDLKKLYEEVFEEVHIHSMMDISRIFVAK
jgi:spermidine synthase